MISYAPHFFNRSTVDEAKGVILSPYGGLGVKERWEVETPWLAERLKFPADGVVVDYGCGIGRVAKAIRRPVLGVDISIQMLHFAVDHVCRQDFIPASPVAFRLLVGSGFRASGAMAIWSLQHVADVVGTVCDIMRGLRSGSPFWLLDLCERHVPVIADGNFAMIGDERKVLQIVDEWCEQVGREPLDVWPQPPPNPGALYEFRRR